MTTDSKTKTVTPKLKQDPRDLVIAILVGTLIAPFTGMVRAIAYRLLWDWFIAPQYGEGPTLQAWFGVGVFYSLISFRRAESDDLSKNPIWRVFESAILGLLMLGSAIVAAAMARVVWRW